MEEVAKVWKVESLNVLAWKVLPENTVKQVGGYKACMPFKTDADSFF